MTAEVCVMNKLGVALAADSAVTRTGAGDPKIYQSADKLFLLSHIDPIAVMIYGSASFMGIPWETIIKLYRRTHGVQSRVTVLDHAKTLMTFLGKSRDLFPEDLQRKYLGPDLAVYFRHLLKRLKNSSTVRSTKKNRCPRHGSKRVLLRWLLRNRSAFEPKNFWMDSHERMQLRCANCSGEILLRKWMPCSVGSQ